jgi:manganese transport protein
LIRFTSDQTRMAEFANPRWVKILAWTAATIIIGLNIWLVIETFGEWVAATGAWMWLILGPLGAGIAALLAFVILHPVLTRRWPHLGGQGALAIPAAPAPLAAAAPAPSYRRILVALDHTERDREAIAHAAPLAKSHNAKIFLVHVEEGVTSQVYGALSSTEEVQAGERYFQEILESLRGQDIETELVVRHASKPSEEIVKVARTIKPDLVVMAAHGHKWWKDIIFGATINAVRHDLSVPVLIVRDPEPPAPARSS